ncbi:hypothetical protein HanPSC8_Chr00c234g0806751 [Helianthus annuus]|nr:hypothetical protein HanPSC8_Chr00c234g0806751 [Helianthus annuus]
MLCIACLKTEKDIGPIDGLIPDDTPRFPNLKYQDVHGTSVNKVAVRFDAAKRIHVRGSRCRM